MPHRTNAVVPGRRRRTSVGRLPSSRPIAAVAVVIAAQLGNARLATDEAVVAGPRLTTVVSIRGATGRWTPTETPTAVPAAPVATDPATAPPVPNRDRSVVPARPVPETITPTATGASSVTEVPSPNQPEP